MRSPLNIHDKQLERTNERNPDNLIEQVREECGRMPFKEYIANALIHQAQGKTNKRNR